MFIVMVWCSARLDPFITVVVVTVTLILLTYKGLTVKCSYTCTIRG